LVLPGRRKTNKRSFCGDPLGKKEVTKFTYGSRELYYPELKPLQHDKHHFVKK
jgi:hypothetical protein